MYLLDTGHISLIDRGGDEGQRILRRLAGLPEEDVAISVVSYEEQTRGLLAQVARIRAVDLQVPWYERMERLLSFYSSMPLVSFDAVVVNQFQELWVQRIRIGTMDLKIAATALAQNATLITRNTQDFAKVPGLRLEDWSIE
ncbi:type II toxin-antitoxin system VapC family toxin [Armatimonas sp.]|uniref:type II toxin-antitoxin system VapC family toxin n=1 Tax=Armatimonas sp. TaxID=1872638 RepID=UPI0037522A9E